MHPAVQKLIEEQRAQKEQEREEILRSLGLVEEHEEREYATKSYRNLELAQYYGYDHCEMIDGQARYYRVKQTQVPIKLTDDEYAEVYNIYRVRKATEGQRSPMPVTITAPESKFEPSFLSQTFRAFAWICWFGGLIGAIALSYIEIENDYGRVESYFSFTAFLEYCAIVFCAGLLWHAIAHALDALDIIAANTGGRKFSLKKDAK